MMMSLFPFLFLFLPMLEGPVQLLDLVDTESYWAQYGVEVSVEGMAGILAPAEELDAAHLQDLIDGMGAETFQAREEATRALAALGRSAEDALREALRNPDPEIATRAAQVLQQLPDTVKDPALHRLMVIRTLGELEGPEALALVEGFQTTEKPFEAEYAHAALARLKGEAFSRGGAEGVPLGKDLAILPEGLGAAVQVKLALGEAGKTGVENPLRELMRSLDAGARAQFTQMALQLLESYGNLQLDGMTFGLSGKVSNQDGYAVMVFRGRMDADRLRKTFVEQGDTVRTTGRRDWLMDRSGHRAMHFVDDHVLVLVMGADANTMPLEEIAKHLDRPVDEWKMGGELADFFAELPEDLSIRGAGVVTESYRQAEFLKPLKLGTLTGRRGDAGEMDLALSAEAKDGETRDELLVTWQGYLKNAMEMVAQMDDAGPGGMHRGVRGGMMPFDLGFVMDFLKTLEIEKEEPAGISVRGQVPPGAVLKGLAPLLQQHLMMRQRIRNMQRGHGGDPFGEFH
ncbi:MAG: HEAT repeat domain-containing protein [Verrucomicrobia bacterium]|nr:HEAT repeat domain-containing protein [Verrucomicrobiota bacterium]MCH8514283.1 HEAT repeat domain-containing protein [Kiritimatiellia bacterium]